jgi:hypothetical protein
MNHAMGPLLLLLNGNFTLLNAELNDKQLTKCTYLKTLLQTETSEIKQAMTCLTFIIHKFF